MITATEPQHVSALAAMLYPGATRRCDHCGGYVATSVEESLKRYAETLTEPLQSLTKALSDPAMLAAYGLPTYTGAGPATTKHYEPWGGMYPHGYQPGHWWKDKCGCGCRACVKDDCHCRCCVVDADLVVHARLGERRVVPLVLENNRRREREITLELSTFTSKGGRDTNVSGEVLGQTEFTLAPCAEREIVIAISISDDDDEKSTDRERLPDVDECEVSYADLRIVGCDNRSIRLAVAVLPRDCHAYRIDCHYGCC